MRIVFQCYFSLTLSAKRSGREYGKERKDYRASALKLSASKFG